MIFTAEKDEQCITAKFEQVAVVTVGHLQQGSKEPIDDGRDFFRAFFAELGQLFRHGRKARDVGKHHRAVNKAALDLAGLGIRQQGDNHLPGKIRGNGAQQRREALPAEVWLPQLVAMQTLPLKRRWQIIAQGLGQCRLVQRVAELRHRYSHSKDDSGRLPWFVEEQATDST